MPLLVHCFGWEVCKAAVLLFLQTRLHVPDALGRLDSLFLDTLVVLPWFGQDPLVRGHYSFVGGHSKSSIVWVKSDPVLFGHHTACSHSKMGGLVNCLETGSGEHGPST